MRRLHQLFRLRLSFRACGRRHLLQEALCLLRLGTRPTPSGSRGSFGWWSSFPLLGKEAWGRVVVELLCGHRLVPWGGPLPGQAERAGLGLRHQERGPRGSLAGRTGAKRRGLGVAVGGCLPRALGAACRVLCSWLCGLFPRWACQGRGPSCVPPVLRGERAPSLRRPQQQRQRLGSEDRAEPACPLPQARPPQAGTCPPPFSAAPGVGFTAASSDQALRWPISWSLSMGMGHWRGQRWAGASSLAVWTVGLASVWGSPSRPLPRCLLSRSISGMLGRGRERACLYPPPAPFLP